MLCVLYWENYKYRPTPVDTNTKYKNIKWYAYSIGKTLNTGKLPGDTNREYKKYKKKICVILWENRPPAANPCKNEFKSPTQDKHEFTALSCELKSRRRDYARKNN